MPNKVIVSIPSSTANLGPGFDVFSMALDAFKDIVEVIVDFNGEGLEIIVDEAHRGLIPSRVEENSAGLAAKKFLEETGVKGRVEIRVLKGIEPGIGLGSSAASAAGVVVALNEAFKCGLSKLEMVGIAAYGELASAGAIHLDNVAAAVYGGFNIVIHGEELRILNFKPPKNLGFVLAIPKIKIPIKKTEYARSIIPKEVSIKKLTMNVANASSLVAGILTSNIKLIGESMRDFVVEPARSKLIPGFSIVKEMVLKAGAYGVAISGAGPSMIAVVDLSESKHDEVKKAFVAGFKKVGVEASVLLTKPCEGAKVVSSVLA